MLPPSLIAVHAQTPELQTKARALSDKFGLPLALCESSYSYLLVLAPERLELRQSGPGAPGPVFVQWNSASTAYRRRDARQEAIARAVGVKNRPNIVDATAGLGRDSFMLASLACSVRMVERSPVIFALLEDALRRAEPEILKHLSVIQADGRDYLRELSPTDQPDVIYLDPMYPGRQKSALVKKESRLLRAVVGDDGDADELLDVALQAARQRVVVKRPRLAAHLADLAPTYTVKGRSTRFDVYIKNSPDHRP